MHRHEGDLISILTPKRIYYMYVCKGWALAQRSLRSIVLSFPVYSPVNPTLLMMRRTFFMVASW
jgi:hypothetical protein